MVFPAWHAWLRSLPCQTISLPEPKYVHRCPDLTRRASTSGQDSAVHLHLKDTHWRMIIYIFWPRKSIKVLNLPFALFPWWTHAGSFRRWQWGGISTRGQVSFDAAVVGHDWEASHVRRHQVAGRLTQLKVLLLLAEGELLRRGAGPEPLGHFSPCQHFNIHHLHVIQRHLRPLMMRNMFLCRLWIRLFKGRTEAWEWQSELKRYGLWMWQ